MEEKMQYLKMSIEAAINETDKDKQRVMVQEIMDSPEMARFKELFLRVWNQIKEFVIKCERTIKKYKRTAYFKRQHIKYKRWCN
ncbi:hypothetical protein OWO82_25860 [Bacillus paranthracis]|uniref:hypothetical protein n=1 Tax=Bacillus paranthracis TaxID=2026186 RepID=UPI0025513FFB|nr:hypothetical protein [Bacillus paranthracis]MDK7486771.1 hypothetical protein [Bacillus paranthracis]MDK7497653.1 hypothetical protein [Bacillus paranthracis]